jgi:DMSO/TMAO reductase YedYZ molybdopterin-dependent catalytic subunit
MDLSITGDVSAPRTWTWEDFRTLPSEDRTDVHSVTKWSKLDTSREGVSIDTLLDNRSSPSVRSIGFRHFSHIRDDTIAPAADS